MAIDCFMKIDGIEGESADFEHVNEIELVSWSWGATQTGTSGNEIHNVAVQDLSAMIQISKASPKLFLACASGTRLKSAVLTCRRPVPAGFDFLKIKLSEVIVSSYQISCSNDMPVESISLNFARVEYEYTPIKPDGSAGAKAGAGWDLVRNMKC